MQVLHWFRSDLRAADNTALAAAARRAERLACCFVLDERLLRSERQGAARIAFLHASLGALQSELAEHGHALIVRRGDPARELTALATELAAQRVTFNRDYSPYAQRRDGRVRAALERAGVAVQSFKDRVVFEASELRTGAGRPYAVYTPYRRAWWARLGSDPLPEPAPLHLPPPPEHAAAGSLPPASALGGGCDVALPEAGSAAALRRLHAFLDAHVGEYARERDFPARPGTSRLSPYLRLGAISVRACVRSALAAAQRRRALRPGVEKWIDELVWRDFYHALLAERPHMIRRSLRPELEDLEWNEDAAALQAWREGRTGYPFVDAAMRELLTTGWVHNRARMVAASFLVKDLGIDWREGERWFMQRLVDGDPASNSGGWQWSASTGTDAQPYFRILNPVTQGEKFDPEGEYVRRFVPELRGLDGARAHRPWDAPLCAPGYPARIVDHARAREQALARFRAARTAVQA